MDIRFEDRGAFVVSGYAAETSPATNDTDLGALWEEYRDKLIALPESRASLYGVLWYTENHSYFYLLGIEAPGSLLEGASTSVEIPAARFAVATVPDNMTAAAAWTEYFDKALPALGFAPDAEHGKYFEYYDQHGVCELWTPVVRAKGAGTTGVINNCEEKLRLAMLSGDIGALDALISDDLAFVNHFGQLISKEDDLSAHKQGAFKLADIRFIDQRIRDMGEVAVAVTETEIEGYSGGAKLSDHLIYTRIWQKTNGEWQLIGGQATRIE